MLADFGGLAGARVAVVGCGTSPIGKGLGRRIDSCDYVLRANRAWNTEGKQADYGERTDLLAVGLMMAVLPYLPNPRPFPVVGVPMRAYGKVDREAQAIARFGVDWPTPKEAFAKAWGRKTRPLAGTFLAVMAAHSGCDSLLLVGLDLYADARKPSAFKGHQNIHDDPTISLLADREVLAGLGRIVPTEWVKP